jgi:hypothetical protein
MSDAKEFKINAKTLSLADRIDAAAGGVDKNNTLEDNDIFRKIATEDGRNVDQMISDDEYRSDFIHGLTLSRGRRAKKHFQENPDVGTVSGTFEIGRNRLELSFEKHVPNRILDKESGSFKVDGEKDVYGDATVKYKVRGTQNSKGELKAVREFLQDDYLGTFGAFSS